MAGLLWCLFLALSMGTAHCTSPCISLTVPGCNCSQMPLWQCNLDKCVQSKALLVSGCELSGTIPPAIGEHKFEKLDLSHNQLTGAIPSFLKETSIAIPTFFSEPGINQSNLYGFTPVCYVCMLAPREDYQYHQHQTAQKAPGPQSLRLLSHTQVLAGGHRHPAFHLQGSFLFDHYRSATFIGSVLILPSACRNLRH